VSQDILDTKAIHILTLLALSTQGCQEFAQRRHGLWNVRIRDDAAMDPLSSSSSSVTAFASALVAFAGEALNVGSTPLLLLMMMMMMMIHHQRPLPPTPHASPLPLPLLLLRFGARPLRALSCSCLCLYAPLDLLLLPLPRFTASPHTCVCLSLSLSSSLYDALSITRLFNG
jgi:hypothetical protein